MVKRIVSAPFVALEQRRRMVWSREWYRWSRICYALGWRGRTYICGSAYLVGKEKEGVSKTTWFVAIAWCGVLEHIYVRRKHSSREEAVIWPGGVEQMGLCQQVMARKQRATGNTTNDSELGVHLWFPQLSLHADLTDSQIGSTSPLMICRLPKAVISKPLLHR